VRIVTVNRGISRGLIVGQLLGLIPAPVLARPAVQTPQTPLPVAAASAPPTVRVNRTVPTVTPVSATPVFSASAPDSEIMRARVFPEPLVPVGGVSDALENRALASALTAYVERGSPETTGDLDAFLRQYPHSRWRAALLTNLGLVLRRTGYVSRALLFWEDAWALSKDATDRPTRQLADRALGELFELNARLGRADVLEQWFTAIEGRDVIGSATEQVAGARQALWLMRNRPGEAFRCGPLAVHAILRATRADSQGDARVLAYPSTLNGTSLAQMRTLAGTVGLDLQMAQRLEVSAPLPLPAVVHWRTDHFAAVIREENGRVLVHDATFGEEWWISRAAFDQEASGVFLVPGGILPPGWRAVGEAQGAEVWGRGINTGVDPACTDSCGCKTVGGDGPGASGGKRGDDQASGACPSCGLATYRFHALVVSLNLQDTPVGYAPPRGPAVRFTVTYSQRDAYQPQTFAYANLGPKWTFDWLSYVEDDPTNPAAAVGLYVRGGGHETHTGYNAATQSYAPYKRNQAILVRTSSSPIRYERRLNDGAVEVFAQPDGVATYPRRIFLTAWRDPQGNTVTFTYDASLRMVAATDALGQVTTIAYEHADPLKITKVTDPFGRFSTFEYDAAGRLLRITDVIGLQSVVTYGVNDFVTSLTTPYGTTTFLKGEEGLNRWLEAIDPLGGRERVAYGGGADPSDPAGTVPTGMLTTNSFLQRSNSHYWDKRAMALAPGDRTAAWTLHWAELNSGQFLASGTLESERRPLERRVWYNYPGQTTSNFESTIYQPSVTGRVLDDGTTQLWKTTDNSRGQVTSRTDPLGRRTAYVYAPNEIDLLEVRQTTGTLNDLLATYSNYTAHHLPGTITDAAGQETTFTYNTSGQILTVTNAKHETTTYVYDANGYLLSVTGSVAGTTTLTYDGYGRVRTTTDADGYTTTMDYDALDRPTRVTYPDGTYEETMYDRLDPVARRDRAGRWTRTVYDAMRRVVSVRDPAGRTITQQWCTCGSLDAVIDAKGQRTSWERDLQGRVTREVRADGITATVYAYQSTTSRLKTITDPKQQVTTYTYRLDDALQSTVYTNAQIPTPSVSYTYETGYHRLATMVDGVGTTTYGYKPVGVLGAGQVASVDGPLVDDTVTYAYDELGRITSRLINGVGTTQSYDALGRMTTEINPLGTFTYGYDGVTSRIANVTYPNGQTSDYVYLGTLGDHRLQTIHHKRPGGATLSKFDYTYDVVGSILTWRQQADSDPAVEWRYTYDLADQLLTGDTWSTGTTPAVLKRYAYTYDAAGNRTSEQIDDSLVESVYDNLNRLVQQRPGGTLRFAGAVNEPATVTIQGRPADVGPDNSFRGIAPVTPGTNTVTIAAADGSGNPTTQQYQIDVAGATKALTYDANGNLTSDGTRTFEWDARNQLVAVNVGTHRGEFTYDGLQRRVRIVTRDSGIVKSDTKTIWCETGICEERAADGETTIRRVFALGDQADSVARFHATDHLGTVGEVTNGASTLLVRYAYDPWGRRALTTGSDVTSEGFTGQRWMTEGAVGLTQYRAYDSSTGRWLSEDPAGLLAGSHLYRYVDNAPVAYSDPDGLMKRCCRPVRGLSSACHCWIVLDDGQTIGGYRFGAWLFQIANHTDDRPTPRGSTCEELPLSTCQKKQVGKTWADYPDTTVYRPTNTSNTAVSKALQSVGQSLPTCAIGR